MVVHMDTTPFIESLRRDLLAAAEAAGPEGRAAAERMLLAFEPAMRLALLDALSQATAEITSELPAGVVEVRLRGREPELVVDVPPLRPPHEAPAASGPAAPDEEEDDGTVARITLRIPESVKTRAEELAGKSGHSLNAWIVNVLRAATTQRAINVDIDLSSLPFLDTPGSGRRPGGRRMTGWI
jgi:hypothetical protein